MQRGELGRRDADPSGVELERRDQDSPVEPLALGERGGAEPADPLRGGHREVEPHRHDDPVLDLVDLRNGPHEVVVTRSVALLGHGPGQVHERVTRVQVDVDLLALAADPTDILRRDLLLERLRQIFGVTRGDLLQRSTEHRFDPAAVLLLQRVRRERRGSISAARSRARRCTARPA